MLERITFKINKKYVQLKRNEIKLCSNINKMMTDFQFFSIFNYDDLFKSASCIS